MNFLYESRSLNGGEQRLYRFANGYGASVIRHKISYGSEHGLWELAVIKFLGAEDGFYLVYNTHITDDVIGHLTEEEVEKHLCDIVNLPRTE